MAVDVMNSPLALITRRGVEHKSTVLERVFSKSFSTDSVRLGVDNFVDHRLS